MYESPAAQTHKHSWVRVSRLSIPLSEDTAKVSQTTSRESAEKGRVYRSEDLISTYMRRGACAGPQL
jgi:hypothetical protein